MKITLVSSIDVEKDYIKNNNLKHKLNQGRYSVWRTGGSTIQTEVSWEHQDLKAVIQEWQKYTLPTSDKRFTPTLLLSSEKTAPLLMHGIFHGSVTDLQKLIQPLLQIGSPIKVDIKELSYLEAIT
ncbi:hypothetical protein BTGOE6_11390 [Bacillus wiedmannii]|nr:hypothetical protein [Bacillus wiedmannii]OFD11286.1 hypothetical protein BTGOE6_11390 [Bacillus wiedmannii]